MIYRRAELSFHRPIWYILFNDIWPKARFTFIIKNIVPKEDLDAGEGILVLEIAEAKDEGSGYEPGREKFTLLSYKMFDTIKKGTQLEFVFTLTEKYKPGKFRIKPTLFIYPTGESPIHSLYKKMEGDEDDAFKAWESLYFSEWDKNLFKDVSRVIRIEGKSELIIIRDFNVLGLSLIGVIVLICAIFKRVKKILSN